MLGRRQAGDVVRQQRPEARPRFHACVPILGALEFLPGHVAQVVDAADLGRGSDVGKGEGRARQPAAAIAQPGDVFEVRRHVLVAGTDPDKLQRWVAWGFGSFSGVTWQKLSIFAPLVLAALGVSLATTKQLNALLLGENYARSMGLNVRRMRLVTMGGASVLGGVVTAFCGPVAFLGIAIPHMCRALLGSSDHRVLVPATVLMGGIVALVSQMVSLLPGSSGVLPLNAVTSLIGAPVVVIVLLRSRKGAFTG